ncbi:MAG: hypothetical protein OEV42_18065 [Deltaproteobacteria bacterium]|nr:hypothetical protein [Deltaproteobacteria bacterium]
MNTKKKIQVLLGLLLLLSLVAARYFYNLPDDYMADKKTRYKVSLEKGVDALKNDRLDDAIASLRRAKYFKPDSFKASLNLAKAFHAKKGNEKYDKLARYYITEAIKMADDYRDQRELALFCKTLPAAYYCQDVDEPETYEERIKKAITGKPKKDCKDANNKWNCMVRKGNMAFYAGHEKKAADWYEAAIIEADNLGTEIKRKTARFMTRYKLGIAYFSQRAKIDKALGVFATLKNDLVALRGLPKYVDYKNKTGKEIYEEYEDRIAIYKDAAFVITTKDPNAPGEKIIGFFKGLFQKKKEKAQTEKWEKEFALASARLKKALDREAKETRLFDSIHDMMAAGYLADLLGKKYDNLERKEQAKYFFGKSKHFYNNALKKETAKDKNLVKTLKKKIRLMDKNLKRLG